MPSRGARRHTFAEQPAPERGRLPVTLNPGGQCVRRSCKDQNELIVFEIAHRTKNFLPFREKSCDLFMFLSIICYGLSLASYP